MLGTTCPVTLCHTTEEFNFQYYECRNRKKMERSCYGCFSPLLCHLSIEEKKLVNSC